KGSQKRRTSRPRKQRNQNSKSDGIASTNTNEVKSTNETETTQEEKPKEETTIETGEEPLPPRDTDKKEPEVEKSTE
ncbi:unnamed protein product, partial [Rotaria magnacalcarata]